MKGELGEYIDKHNGQVVWKAITVAIDKQLAKHGDVAEIVSNILVNAIKKDLSKHFSEPPHKYTINISDNEFIRARELMVDWRIEIKKKLPTQEKLWYALDSLYEDYRNVGNTLKNVQDKLDAYMEKYGELEE